MSRSGYVDDYDYDDPLELGRHRAAVSSAIRGTRGQALLRELAVTLDAMPEKKLTAHVWDEQETCQATRQAMALVARAVSDLHDALPP